MTTPKDSDLLAQLGHSCNHIGEEAGAEPSALVREMDAEPSEQRHRLRVAAGTLAQPRWRVSNMMLAKHQA